MNMYRITDRVKGELRVTYVEAANAEEAQEIYINNLDDEGLTTGTLTIVRIEEY